MRPLLVLLLLAAAAGAPAQTIGPGAAVPVVAHISGVGFTFWQSDVVIHNPNDGETAAQLLLFPEIKGGEPDFEIRTSDWYTIPARGQLTLTNVMVSVFGLYDTKGGMSVISNNGNSLVVGSRTYTYGNDGGSFGQDVSGVLVAERAWAAGARQDGFFRTNVGIYLPVSPAVGQSVSFTVLVRDGEGAEVATATMAFPEAGMQQRSLESMGVSLLTGGSVEVSCSDPAFPWYGYISRIDYLSGDAVYRPLRGEAYSKDG